MDITYLFLFIVKASTIPDFSLFMKLIILLNNLSILAMGIMIALESIKDKKALPYQLRQDG
jgi:hypothetical protein